MPTKKPVIQCVLEDSIFRKLKVLAGKENRSTSNIAGTIVTKYIEDYEKEHGKIEIPPRKHRIGIKSLLNSLKVLHTEY